MHNQTSDPVDEAGLDLRMLLDRGYTKDYALRFVGDHHRLIKKQRNLLFRQIFSEKKIGDTQRKLRNESYIRGRHVVVDTFNVLITLEHALSGGQVFMCQDGILRDNVMAFSNYKIGDGTRNAVDAVIGFLVEQQPKTVRWVLDSQISGSGGLTQYILKKLEKEGLKGEATTSPTADHRIIKLNLLTATSDSALIRQVNEVIDLPQLILSAKQVD